MRLLVLTDAQRTEQWRPLLAQCHRITCRLCLLVIKVVITISLELCKIYRQFDD